MAQVQPAPSRSATKSLPRTGAGGLATEAAAGLVVFAFDHDEVHAVLAHTLAHPGPSPALLRTLGFERTQELADPEDGHIWQWRLERP